ERSALGDDLSQCRSAAPASLAALRGRAGRSAAVHHPVGLCAQAAPHGGSFRCVSDRLWGGALPGGVHARARQLPGTAESGTVDGTVAQSADDRSGDRPARLGLSATPRARRALVVLLFIRRLLGREEAPPRQQPVEV